MDDTSEDAATPAAAVDSPTGPQAHDVPRPTSQRPITLYDAVAGRAGLNGFLTREQKNSPNVLPLAPEEVLLQRTSVLPEVVSKYYDAAARLSRDGNSLPESEVLKTVHSYASDFYTASAEERGTYDFRSLDETALIAMGILLEEAAREALGENGDMVFVEPEGLERGLDESKMVKYQVKGRVQPAASPRQDPEEESDDDKLQEEESPAKRRKYD